MASRGAITARVGKGAGLDLTSVLGALYASEINCGLQSFWDGGWSVWIGDDMNGRRAAVSLDRGDHGLIARWLAEAAVAIYPRGFFPWALSTNEVYRPDHADPAFMREWMSVVPSLQPAEGEG